MGYSTEPRFKKYVKDLHCLLQGVFYCFLLNFNFLNLHFLIKIFTKRSNFFTLPKILLYIR